MLKKTIKSTLCILNSTKRFITNFDISSEVQDAISGKNKPIVALETAVITHGMPWPTNYETGLLLENQIRNNGAIPATIGIYNGQIKVGFDSVELETLARSTLNASSNAKPTKISRSNLYNYNKVQYGGTTVGGTIIICNQLGISIFATGGIGGVHRDVHESMDISSDLKELGRHEICVVSSGIKSLLDIRKTLEYLETEGVYVGTLNSIYFPGFLSRSSGIITPNRFDNIEEIVNRIKIMRELKIKSGMLIAVPIPEHEEDDHSKLIEDSINEAVNIAKLKEVSCVDVTPFILNKVNELTKGLSLELNVKLIENNALIASEIAKNLHISNNNNINLSTHKSDYVVIGGSIIDVHCKLVDQSIDINTIEIGGTYDSIIKQSSGGVGRNLADVITKLGYNCHFLTAIGNDIKSNFLINDNNKINWYISKRINDIETSSVTAIHLANKDILLYAGDLKIHNCINPEYINKSLSTINHNNIKLTMVDGNIPFDSLKQIIIYCNKWNIPLFYEPTDIVLIDKVYKLINENKIHSKLMDIISPNIDEFQKLMNLMGYSKNKKLYDVFIFVKSALKATNLLDLIPYWIIKMGSKGVIFISKSECFYIKQSIFLTNKRIITNASGAGDCLAAATACLKFSKNLTWTESISGGIKMALEAIKSESTVPRVIDKSEFDGNNIKLWTKNSIDQHLLRIYK